MPEMSLVKRLLKGPWVWIVVAVVVVLLALQYLTPSGGYDEIRALTPGRTFTNLNKSLVKARARIRHARDPRQ